MKPVYCYLLIHPEWLKGSPGTVGGQDLGGYSDAPVDATALWYDERLKNLRLVEVRGRIKLSEDTSHVETSDAQPVEARAAEQPAVAEAESDEVGEDAEDRKLYGVPRFLTLADGRRMDTRRGTIPKQSHFACAACGMSQDLRESVQATQRGAPVAAYVAQGHCPQCDEERRVYGGRFFTSLLRNDTGRLASAEREWHHRRDSDLQDYWPREELPHTYMTHHANFALPKQGYTHWWTMFNSRQLLVHAELFRFLTCCAIRPYPS